VADGQSRDSETSCGYQRGGVAVADDQIGLRFLQFGSVVPQPAWNKQCPAKPGLNRVDGGDAESRQQVDGLVASEEPEVVPVFGECGYNGLGSTGMTASTTVDKVGDPHS